ncbi:MAG: 30S ribosomal protein S6 [Patescibacteria group bacterium]|nr:30S ribosomal protein S6 [Patescibacteria group bacterium]
MDTVSREYEVAFLVREEDGASKVVALIGKYGTILSQGQLKRVAFAYPIEKTAAGYFGTVKVSVLPDAVVRLEKDLETTSEALRSLVLRLPVVKESSVQDEQSKPRRARLSRSEVSPKSSATLTNEALEKKIEEILQ